MRRPPRRCGSLQLHLRRRLSAITAAFVAACSAAAMFGMSRQNLKTREPRRAKFAGSTRQS
jgi:hypothetical protein